MTDAEYHAHPALSATKLKTMATGTPRRYWAMHENPDRKPFTPTEPMRQGSLVDCLITIPERFGLLYVRLPEDAPKRPTKTQLNAKKPSAATLDAIAFWEAFDNEAQGREPVTKDWLDNAFRIIEVLHADPEIGPLLEMSRQSQRPFFWDDAAYGVECRYKPDLELEDGSLIDLKKAANASPRGFGAQAYKLGYDIQLAHYSEGYTSQYGRPPERHGFIAYEWSHPYDCSLIWVDDDYMAMGSERRASAITRILECRASQQWPSYGACTIGPPTYAALRGADDDLDLADLELEGL